MRIWKTKQLKRTEAYALKFRGTVEHEKRKQKIQHGERKTYRGCKRSKGSDLKENTREGIAQ